RRRNFASVCSAAVIAVEVRLRPSSPPAPRRTISFSLSMTSKDRSGLTRTTIMWIELVPMSMAALRMSDEVERQGWPRACLLQHRYILVVRSNRAASYHDSFAPPGPSPGTPHRCAAPPARRCRRRKGHRRASGTRGVAAPAGGAACPDRWAPAHQIGEGATQDPADDGGGRQGARARRHAVFDR